MPWELKGGVSSGSRVDKRRLGITLLGASGAFVALVLVGLLMAVPFMVRRDVSPGTSFQLGDLRALTDIATESDGSYQLTLQFNDARGVPVDPKILNVTLAMDGHAMEPDPVQVERTWIGAYRATGRLAMTGRWRFNIASDRGAADMVVNYAKSF